MSVQKVLSSQSNAVLPASTSSCSNILMRFQELVNRISNQLQKLSEETQTKSQTMKREYRVSSEKASLIEKSIGVATPIITALPFCAIGAINAFCGLKGIDTQAYRESIQNLAFQGIPSLGQVYTGNLRSSQMLAQSTASLRQAEISNEGQKSGEARDLLQEIQQILANIRDLYKKASS